MRVLRVARRHLPAHALELLISDRPLLPHVAAVGLDDEVAAFQLEPEGAGAIRLPSPPRGLRRAHAQHRARRREEERVAAAAREENVSL
ncbi:MAG: hypothetical protein QOJ70_800 [Acidobacteriota bacterium]|jgi:hypothetical protein|nr:hypothetical protein [Acidobacteriota bacterium]